MVNSSNNLNKTNNHLSPQTKQTTTSHLKLLNIKKTTNYDVGNPDPVLGQAQKCGRDKPVNGIPTLPLDLHCMFSNKTLILKSKIQTVTSCMTLQIIFT